MASKLHQHAILTGCVDSFCLVCEGHLRSEQDAAIHIEKPVHLKNLRSTPYLPKFADDHIRKVKKGYFCEFCNVLLPTAAKVGLHVAETTHNDNKGVQLITRLGKNVIVFEDILISEQAWNGLITDTCAVCNLEFHNLKLHIADQKHVLNLIQKKVEFDGSTVYRRIDDTSFHCLICNAIFTLNAVTTHSKDEVHVTNIDKCKHFNKSSIDSKHVNGVENGEVDTQQPNTEQKLDNNTNDKEKQHKTENFIHNNSNNIEKKNSTPLDNTNESNSNKITNSNDKFVNQKEQPVRDKPEPTKKENKQLVHKENKKGKAQEIQMENTAAKTAKQNAKLVSNDLNQTKNKSKDVKKSETVDKDKLFEHVTEFQKNGVSINFETETAFCKKCFEEVILDINGIKNHIDEHKNNPKKEITANNDHTMNQNHSRTVLNSKDLDDKAANKPTVNFDLNHNVTRSEPKPEEKEEEIIKIDLRKNAEEDSEKSETDKSVARYVAGTSAPEPLKQPGTTRKPAKQVPDTNDPEAFAKQHTITYNKGNGNAFCRVCSKRIPAAIKNMKEHVTGMSHQTKLARIVQTEKTAKVPSRPMIKFIHTTSTVTNMFGVDDVILNDKYCLTRMSFCMITTQNRLRCQACEVSLSKAEVSGHLDGVFHERAMERTPVVTTFSSEFIREVRPGVFHCGFCNQVIGGWDVVASHLQCGEHRARAAAAAARLRDHLPDILAHRQAREEVFAMRFLQRLWPFWD